MISKTYREEFDLIVVGGGPAGATLALYASKYGLNVLLVDQKQFPRDKICGDCLPSMCIPILRELGLLDKVMQAPCCRIQYLVMHTQQEILRVPYKENLSIVSKRWIFDNILFQAAKSQVKTQEGWRVKRLLVQDGQVVGIEGTTRQGTHFECRGKVVAGADGYSSIVARQLGWYRREPEHWAVATRAYYHNVSVSDCELEFHYFPKLQGHYVWIFPVDDKRVNVGVGTKFKKENGSLTDLHHSLIHSTYLKSRFEKAQLIGKVHGWNLPLASVRRPMHGNGVILVGDAAGLIDPLWGDGIDTAMVAAKIAGQHLSAICQGGDFCAENLRQYADAVWEELGPRFKRSHTLLKLLDLWPLYARSPLQLLNKFLFGAEGTLLRQTKR